MKLPKKRLSSQEFSSVMVSIAAILASVILICFTVTATIEINAKTFLIVGFALLFLFGVLNLVKTFYLDRKN